MIIERLSTNNIFERNTSARTVFFSDDYEIVEAPTHWIGEVAMRRSKSTKTEEKYSRILGKYLQWLDDSGYGCLHWNTIDEEIFNRYIESIQNSSSANGGAPSSDTVADYVRRIVDFYTWARERGYKHYLELKMQEVEVYLENQKLLGHLGSKKRFKVPDVSIDKSAANFIKRERNKFVTNECYKAALKLMTDPVFVVIATIIRITAMRPKELLQLPYRGDIKNPGFVPYDADEIPHDLAKFDIDFICESKGKKRCVRFPGKLWEAICLIYIPLRRERAKKYRRRVGVSPPNSALFLTVDGYIVTYPVLYYHFSKISRITSKVELLDNGGVYFPESFNARMLRHTCATYFVIDALRLKHRLGKPYVYDAGIDEDLRMLLGHADVETTYKYYVHIINRMHGEDLLYELHRNRVDSGLSEMLDKLNFS